MGGVWEVPITNYETGIGRLRRLRHLDVVAASWPEMMQVLNAAEHFNLDTIVFLLHSFSFLKRKDVQFRIMRPDRLVIRRFEALCGYLRKNSTRFRVITFVDRPRLISTVKGDSFPRLGALLPLCRMFVQGLNRAYWV